MAAVKRPTLLRRRPRLSKHSKDLERYCDDIVEGKTIVGKLERAAVERYRHDCDTAGARGLYWDDEEFERTITFVELLKHSTGEFAGHPFKLQPWQKFVAGNLFAWKSKDTGLRRFREAFVSMGRGNGKSPFMSALINRLYILDNEHRAQFQLAAVERAQAEIVFNEICEQLQSQPAFNDRFEYYRAKHGKKSIVDTILGGVIEPLGSEGRDGYNLLGYVADEIHAWTEEHQPLWEKLESSMRKRRQPLALVITTAGDDRSKLWLRVHEFSSKVARRIIEEDRHFSFICEIDDADRRTSLFDETLWRKGNPNIDVSVKRDALRLIANKAKNDAVCFNEWLRYHMNIRVRAVTKVIIQAVWSANDAPLPDMTKRICHGGLDLGWRNDIASLYFCFPLPEKKFAFRGWNWLPEHGGRDLTAAPWSQWIRDGHLTSTDGEVTDHDSILSRIANCRSEYQIQSIAYDPANARIAGNEIVNKLCLNGFDFWQSAKNYNEPCREFLTALTEKRIIHGGDPVLSWAADNLVLRSDSAGLVMPDKTRADEKIDPIVAALMAFARCLYGEPPSQGPRIRSL